MLTVYSEFWPINLLRQKYQEQLTKESVYVVRFCFAYTLAACTSVFQYYAIPLIFGIRQLPFLTDFSPFNWKQSPYYEILLVWESFIEVNYLFIVCGFDILFVGLLWNCIAQLKMLRYIIQSDFKNAIQRNKPGTYSYLIKILIHHQKVIRYGKFYCI